MAWAAAVFGWPGALMSILAGCWGVFSGRWPWTLGGALAGAPFLFYLSMTPRFGWIAMLTALSYAGAVFATYRRRRALAWLLFVPMPALAAYTAIVVVSASRSWLRP